MHIYRICYILVCAMVCIHTQKTTITNPTIAQSRQSARAIKKNNTRPSSIKTQKKQGTIPSPAWRRWWRGGPRRTASASGGGARGACGRVGMCVCIYILYDLHFTCARVCLYIYPYIYTHTSRTMYIHITYYTIRYGHPPPLILDPFLPPRALHP